MGVVFCRNAPGENSLIIYLEHQKIQWNVKLAPKGQSKQRMFVSAATFHSEASAKIAKKWTVISIYLSIRVWAAAQPHRWKHMSAYLLCIFILCFCFSLFHLSCFVVFHIIIFSSRGNSLIDRFPDSVYSLFACVRPLAEYSTRYI